MTVYSGSCLCGGTTYTLKGNENTVVICHCTHCQKQTSSAFSLVVMAPSANVTIDGPLKKYKDKGDSGGIIYRGFCPECGSAILSEAEALPGTAIIKAGTFDDTSWLVPEIQVFCESKQDWVALLEGTSNFVRMPD